MNVTIDPIITRVRRADCGYLCCQTQSVRVLYLTSLTKYSVARLSLWANLHYLVRGALCRSSALKNQTGVQIRRDPEGKFDVPYL